MSHNLTRMKYIWELNGWPYLTWDNKELSLLRVFREPVNQNCVQARSNFTKPPERNMQRKKYFFFLQNILSVKKKVVLLCCQCRKASLQCSN